MLQHSVGVIYSQQLGLISHVTIGGYGGGLYQGHSIELAEPEVEARVQCQGHHAMYLITNNEID